MRQVETDSVLAVEGDSAFGFSGMEIETICRYNLPVCVVVFNNGGIYRGTDKNPAGEDVATTVFVKGARYDKMMEAFGGVGFYATSPDELSRAVNEAMDSGKPSLVNAVIDEGAGTESGRIGISILKASCHRRNRDLTNSSNRNRCKNESSRRRKNPGYDPCSIGSYLYSIIGLVWRGCFES